jgi:hypothetical protein
MQFVAGPDDPLSGAERLGAEYAELENDHDAAVTQFLQRAYLIADQFRRRRGDFERLQVHSFWKHWRQKPRNPAKSKWILFFILRATTTNVRQLASKYAVILDAFKQDQVEIGAVAERIQELGGIEAAYEAMRRPDDCSSRQIGESVMPEPTKRARRSWPQRTLEDVEAAHEAVHGIPKMVGGDDAFDFVQRLAREYAAIRDGDHQAVRRVLQRAYLAVREMRCDPDQFERLQADPFWKAPWRRPKDASTAKWVMLFIMRAKTVEVRIRATKYAVVLDGLQQDQVEIGAVAARIKELGGIDAAYDAMRARECGGAQNKRPPAMALKSQQPVRPTTRTAKSTDGDGSIFFGDTAGERGAYYIKGPVGDKIQLSPAKPPGPARKLNDLDRWGIRISQCKAQLPQARTKEERDHLSKKIRVLEHLLQEGRSKALQRRLAARTKRRLGWKRISGPL